MEQLTFDDKGTFRITTESGTIYLVEVDNGKMGKLSRVNDPDSELSITMRKDASALQLVGIFRCVVGSSAIFMLYGVAEDPKTFTQRITTPVKEIYSMS